MNNNIPIFDSLTHPTINNCWFEDRFNNSSELLIKEMEENNIQWAFAVGMQGIGEYEEQKYYDYVKSLSDKFFPIAYYDFKESETKEEIDKKLEKIKSIGYYGIKLHTRFSNLNFKSKKLAYVMKKT